MTKEKWIENVIKSVVTLREAAPDAFLLQKIQQKIAENNTVILTKSIVMRFSIAASLLIILNFSALTYYRSHSRGHHAESSNTSYSNQFNTGTTYNY